MTLESIETLNNILNNNAHIESTLYTAQLTAIASIIVAILTILGNYMISIHSKKLDYRDDYYRKIIDKRIDAYEKIGQFIASVDVVGGTKIFEDDKKYKQITYYDCCSSVEKLQNKIRHNIDISIYYSWLSAELEQEIDIINTCLVECCEKMKLSILTGNVVEFKSGGIKKFDAMTKEYDETELTVEMYFAKEYYFLLKEHIEKAKEIIKNDRMSLHKVDDFGCLS